MELRVFETLCSINVNDKVEKKNGLAYLTWSYAWQEFVKVCPNARYEVKFFDDKPYIYDEKLGYMVFTSITVGDDTKQMWLPVMDGANKAMKDHPYKYFVTKKNFNTGHLERIEKTCEAASMFDINKTLMRCLTKNIAMFGLGLYIFNGEDLPQERQENERWEGLEKHSTDKK